MAKDLLQLRKEAGFKSSRDFADACGFTYSTYARYEGEPAAIPTKSAWRIADVLGCTIDDVVGRDAEAADMGSMQRRYNALDEEGRSLIDKIMECAELKFAKRQEDARLELEEKYKRQFTYYFLGLFSESAKEGRPIRPDDEKTDELRERFERYARAEIAKAGMSMREGVEEFEGIVRAYDAWVSDDFYDDVG